MVGVGFSTDGEMSHSKFDATVWIHLWKFQSNDVALRIIAIILHGRSLDWFDCQLFSHILCCACENNNKIVAATMHMLFILYMLALMVYRFVCIDEVITCICIICIVTHLTEWLCVRDAFPGVKHKYWQGNQLFAWKKKSENILKTKKQKHTCTQTHAKVEKDANICAYEPST